MTPRWLIISAGVVGVECVVAALMGVAVGHFRAPPIVESLKIACLCVAAFSIFVIAREGRPYRQAVERQFETLRTLLLGGALLAIQFTLASWLKGLLPYWSGGFWADPALADIDKTIFGADPWVASRAWANGLFIEFNYSAWMLLNPVVIYALIVSRPSEAKSVALVALFLMIAVGSFLQFTMPSAGPLFYDLAGHGDRFIAILKGAPTVSLECREWLWRFHEEGAVKAGIGISAMPSMHVAHSVWLCLVARSVAPRWLVPAIVYLAIIWIGSVYTGLHYAVDGAVAVAFVPLCWMLARRMLVTQPPIKTQAQPCNSYRQYR